MNSNSMRNMYKYNTSVLIQERARLNVSKNLTICSLMVVFWANVMNEQWQINNLISWKYLFKNPYVNPKKQFASNWIVAFTQVKSVEHMVKKSISNAHFVVFLSRRCQNVKKRPWNLYKCKTSFWKRNVPQVSSGTSLPWLVQNKPSAPISRAENIS